MTLCEKDMVNILAWPLTKDGRIQVNLQKQEKSRGPHTIIKRPISQSDPDIVKQIRIEQNSLVE